MPKLGRRGPAWERDRGPAHSTAHLPPVLIISPMASSTLLLDHGLGHPNVCRLVDAELREHVGDNADVAHAVPVHNGDGDPVSSDVDVADTPVAGDLEVADVRDVLVLSCAWPCTSCRSSCRSCTARGSSCDSTKRRFRSPANV